MMEKESCPVCYKYIYPDIERNLETVEERLVNIHNDVHIKKHFLCSKTCAKDFNFRKKNWGK
jgi:hypothetical protein